MSTTTVVEKKQLRQQLRSLRQQLSPEQQQQAAGNLVRIVSQESVWLHSQHIAVYISNDGEINPQPLVELGWQLGKNIYLPIIDDNRPGHLLFLPWQPDTLLSSNRFGIPEPKRFASEPLNPSQLDLILLPLVGFDAQGRRLGMGGGFYDRTLKDIASLSSVFMAGLAHSIQEVSFIPTDHWDLSLSAVFTDQAAMTF